MNHKSNPTSSAHSRPTSSSLGFARPKRTSKQTSSIPRDKKEQKRLTRLLNICMSSDKLILDPPFLKLLLNHQNELPIQALAEAKPFLVEKGDRVDLLQRGLKSSSLVKVRYSLDGEVVVQVNHLQSAVCQILENSTAVSSSSAGSSSSSERHGTKFIGGMEAAEVVLFGKQGGPLLAAGRTMLKRFMNEFNLGNITKPSAGTPESSSPPQCMRDHEKPKPWQHGLKKGQQPQTPKNSNNKDCTFISKKTQKGWLGGRKLLTQPEGKF